MSDPKIENPLANLIFHNKYIKINKKTIFYNDWYMHGVKYLNDLMKEGTFIHGSNSRQNTIFKQDHTHGCVTRCTKKLTLQHLKKPKNLMPQLKLRF
jgi:hypothetical protein